MVKKEKENEFNNCLFDELYTLTDKDRNEYCWILINRHQINIRINLYLYNICIQNVVRLLYMDISWDDI